MLTCDHCPALRHACDIEDGMESYGWKFYDARTGGSQIINDTGNHLDITTDFLKSVGQEFQEWQLRVQAIPRAGAQEHQSSMLVFYIASESPRTKITCKRHHSHRVSHSDISCQGTSPTIGTFSIDIGVAGSRNDLQEHLVVNSMKAPVSKTWQAKAIFLEELKTLGSGDGFVPNTPGEGSLHFVQLIFEGSNEIEVSFNSGKEHQTMTSVPPSKRLETIYDDFQKQHALTYQPQPPFKGKQLVGFSQSVLSNFMAGISYFYGRDKISLNTTSGFIDGKNDFWFYASIGQEQELIQERGPRQLLTSTPSRPLLPRGYLFDEGFHQELILDWDMDLALTMLSSWFDVMDDDGWIAREQIIGAEARSKVLPLLQVQFPNFANPPTLFMAVERITELLQMEPPPPETSRQYLTAPSEGKEWLRTIYPKLKRHYEWFHTTQAGNMTHYRARGRSLLGYRWRGRTVKHLQTSGLGDYPRPHPPSVEELHVDALSWVGSMAIVLRKVSALLGETTDEEAFAKHETSIQRSIDSLHWSAGSQAYCDTTLDKKGQILHVCHKGYLSLMPFLLGHLNTTHPHLEAVLDLIRNPGEIWTVYGLRSLSRSDSYYSKGDNYCRGSIWVSFNYMVLKRLLLMSAKPSPLQRKMRKLYSELRVNIVDTVYASWVETGTVWEQYNPQTGKGQRTRDFTGWTALIAKIMAMPELEPSVSAQRSANINKLKPKAGLSNNSFNNVLIFSTIAMILIWLAYRKKLGLVFSRLRRRS